MPWLQRTTSSHYILEEVGGGNGSLVKGGRLSPPATLRNGDRLTLGNAQMVFYNPQETSLGGALVDGDEQATVCHFMQCLVSVLVIDIRGFTVLSQQVDQSVLCQSNGT